VRIDRGELEMKTKSAIACHGGSAETAFTAGAPQALFEAEINKEFKIVSLGGTSGGAVCASLIWYAVREAKFDRGAKNIDTLMEGGRKRARAFLEARKRVVDGASPG
jgi:predicted acylesterase/phospholipase RssA